MANAKVFSILMAKAEPCYLSIYLCISTYKITERQSINDYPKVVDTQLLSLGLPANWKNIGKILVEWLWIFNLNVYMILSR